MSTALTVPNTTTAMAVVGDQSEALAFMPVMAIAQAITRYNATLEFTKQIMKEGKDYGVVPGVDKPSLLKPGAEKLCSFFGLTPKTQVVKEIELWDGTPDNPEPLFYYWYKVRLYRGKRLIAEGEGSANSRESKYRYRWVTEDRIPAGFNKETLPQRGGVRKVSEYDFSIEKAETTGKYGKPAAYWQAFTDAIANKTAKRIEKPMKKETRPGWEIEYGQMEYRVPNPDVADQINTIQKIAVKRALIAATLIACNASEYYTQDVEELEYVDVDHQNIPPTTAEPKQGKPAGTTKPEAQPKQQQPAADNQPADTTPDPWAFEMDEFMGADTAGRLGILNGAWANMRDNMGDDDANACIQPILNRWKVKEWGAFTGLNQAKGVYRDMLDAMKAASRTEEGNAQGGLFNEDLP